MPAPPQLKPVACLLFGIGMSALPMSAAFGQEAVACRADDVPELLALADWPLDTHCPSAKAAGSALVTQAEWDAPVEIPDRPPIPTVRAQGYDDAVPPLAQEEKPLGRRLVALDSHALDGMRGGYEPPDTHLQFSFGIERAVYVNGQLVASTVLTLKDLQVVAGGSAMAGSVSGIDTAGLMVVQNGAGNGFQIQANGNALGTVVQNSLNNQKIQSITTISATVNTAQAMRAIAIQSAIQEGLVNSLRR